MRALLLIREATMDLLVSGGSALLLFISIQELVRRPGIDTAMLGGMVPVTVHKSPWVLVIALLLLALWLRSRALGGKRGAIWGAGRWLVRIGFWWSVIALVLYVCVAIQGARSQSWSDLNWPFAAGFLAVNLLVLTACGIGRRQNAAD